MVMVMDIIGNCEITLNNNMKKQIKFPKGSSWKNPVKADLNGHYIVPTTDYTVLDIDDLTTNQNQHIMNEYMPTCRYVVKTGMKGYHLFYKYNPRIAHIKVLHKLDIISNGCKMLFTYPTTYTDKAGNVYEYKIIKDKKPGEMPEELTNYILELYENRKQQTTNLLADSENIIKKNASKAESVKIVNSFKTLSKEDEIIEDVLMAVHQNRADDFHDWFKVLMILKNEGYKYELFEKFSRRSSKFDDNVITLWNRYKPENAKNRLTIASLWYMLKEDNIDAFNKIKSKQQFKDYTFENYKPTGNFDSKTFIKKFSDDKEIFGVRLLDDDVLCLTNSFKYFSAHHIKITTFGYIRVDFENNVRKITYLNKEFKNSFNEAYISTEKTTKSFIDLFDRNSNKQIYDFVGFEPNTNNEQMFNLFNGFKYENNTDIYNYEIIKPFIEFVEYVFNDTKQADHFFNYMAHIIQKPHFRQPQCYVLYSETHGIGKNTIVNAFASVFAGYYYNLRDADQLTDKFNSEKFGKLLCYGDEIKTFKAGETMSDQIKKIITEPEYCLELKGKDKITNIKDYVHYVFTTNNYNNFYIQQSDRRFNLVKCNTKLLSQSKYTEINKLIATEPFIINLFKYLKNKDLSNYDPNRASVSKYKEELAKQSISLELKLICKNYKHIKGKFLTQSELINLLNGMNHSNKKLKTPTVLFEFLKAQGFKFARPYTNGERGTKVGISFDDNHKSGEHNNKLIKTFMDDDEFDDEDAEMIEDSDTEEINYN